MKIKLFQSPEININEVFDSTTKISKERLDEDMNNSAGKYTSAFARRLSTDFRNEVRRQSGTFEKPDVLTEKEVGKKNDPKKLPPGAHFKKEAPRRRVSRTLSRSCKVEEKKEESLKRGHSPTPEKAEGEFTIPASTTKKEKKRQRQKEKKEAEKKEAEERLSEEAVEQPKEEEKRIKKKSPVQTKKASAKRASVRHNNF